MPEKSPARTTRPSWERSRFGAGTGVNEMAVAGDAAKAEIERRREIGEKESRRAAWRRPKGNRIAGSVEIWELLPRLDRRAIGLLS
jgi:hypothetical protein